MDDLPPVERKSLGTKAGKQYFVGMSATDKLLSQTQDFS